MKQKEPQSGLSPPPPPAEQLEEISRDGNVQDSSGEQSAKPDLEQENTISVASNIENIVGGDGDDDDDDEMDLDNFNVKPKKKRKKGIIYISNIPKHMNVTRMREILGEYAKIGRVYLQPEKLPGSKFHFL